MIVPGAADRIWAATEAGLFKSADAGETWHALESHTTAMLTDGIAINDLRVVISGLAGVLLVSGDAGETFRLTQQDVVLARTGTGLGDTLQARSRRKPRPAC